MTRTLVGRLEAEAAAIDAHLAIVRDDVSAEYIDEHEADARLYREAAAYITRLERNESDTNPGQDVTRRP